MELTLAPVTHDDLMYLWRWHNRPEAEWKMWDAPYFHRDDAPQEFDAFVASQGEWLLGGDCRMVLVDGRTVGLVTRYEEPPAGDGWWELGIIIHDPACWGGGIGSRALDEWTRVTFQETSAHLITLSTWSGNDRMVRAARRVGYTVCARIPEARTVGGRRWDSVRLALLRADAPGREGRRG